MYFKGKKIIPEWEGKDAERNEKRKFGKSMVKYKYTSTNNSNNNVQFSVTKKDRTNRSNMYTRRVVSRVKVFQGPYFICKESKGVKLRFC